MYVKKEYFMDLYNALFNFHNTFIVHYKCFSHSEVFGLKITYYGFVKNKKIYYIIRNM